MQRFSYATFITAKNSLPIATHLPFLVTTVDEQIFLTSYFAKANHHWQDIENNDVLVIFSEPHAYISPANYEKELNVPTWNYISVHAYGKGRLIKETDRVFELLEKTIDNCERSYKLQWEKLPDDYKFRLCRCCSPANNTRIINFLSKYSNFNVMLLVNFILIILQLQYLNGSIYLSLINTKT